MEGSTVEDVSCPVCKKKVDTELINQHLDTCLDLMAKEEEEMSPKRMRIDKSQRTLNDALMPAVSKEPQPASKRKSVSFKPLAEQIRPSDIQNYFGQEHIFGSGCMLRKLVESNNIPSMILWGPPGCGKTTMAHIIASGCRQSSRFITLSATMAGVKDVKDIVEQAKNDQRLLNRKTILFIDEIHRFNKLQQDVFLPHVETGTIILIGATTENPSFSLNSALLSRCRVFVLNKLSVESLEKIVYNALDRLEIKIMESSNEDAAHPSDESVKLLIDKEAVELLVDFCDGDARTALNGLQMAVEALKSASGYRSTDILITKEHIKEGLQRTHYLYDRKGDQHYDTISAFIKSMRGGDANAALYYLARMIEGGEDPKFIARRMIVFASEDVGIADNSALPLAVATHDSVEKIGLPECRITLSHCATYLARSKKSRATYNAYAKAEACVQNHQGPLPPVPLHLRNAPTKLMKELGYGKGSPGLQFLPDALKTQNFFD